MRRMRRNHNHTFQMHLQSQMHFPLKFSFLCGICEMIRKARSHKKVQSVSSQDTPNRHSAQDIADAFCSQYYKYLHEIPEEMHKFYKEESTLSIPADDGSVRSVTTIKEIHKAILESDIIDRDIVLLSVRAQDSIEYSVVVGVVGELSKDNTMKRFSQTFVLAPQAIGFYVHNDSFRFLITNDDTEDNLVLMKDQGTSKKVIKKKSYASIVTKSRSLTIPNATVDGFQKTYGKSSAPPKNEKDITTEASHEVLGKEKSRESSSADKIIDIEKGQDDVEQAKSYATILAKPRLKTKTASSSVARAKPTVASKNIDKTIYVKDLPLQTTRRTLTSAVKKFGNIQHKNIQVRTNKDGAYCYAFMEFNSQNAAKLVVEAGFIQVDGYECAVEYKKADKQDEEGSGTDQ